MRPKRWLTLALTVLAIVTVAGNVAHARYRTKVASNAPNNLAYNDAGLVISGVLSPVATIPIETPVWDLTVPLDSYVTKGQVIGETVSSVIPGRAVQNDEPLFSTTAAGSAVDRAREDVRRAEADLEGARARETDAAVQQVVTRIAERAAKRRYQNAGLQFREGGMQAPRYGEAVLAVDSAVAAADATRSQAEADTSVVGGATIRLLEARARLADAEWQGDLSAPVSGGVRESRWVAVVSPEDGLLVARDPVAGTLGISADPSVMLVEARMPAEDVAGLRVGQSAWVSLDARRQVTLRATVSAIAEVPIDSLSGTVYPVTLSVDNPRGLILAGVNVHVRAASTGPQIGCR